MKADYQSYRVATSRSLFGLALQLVLGLVLLFYAIYARDHAAMTASAFILLGVPAWLSLAFVFDQHRRERIESMEAEAFASTDAAGSSVFEEAGEELRQATRRLRTMHKIVLPVVSLLMGLLLILTGFLRFGSGVELIDPDVYTLSKYPPLAMTVGLMVGLFGFLMARYASGMAKQEMWANLRGGASYSAGAAVFGLLIAIGQFVDIAGPDVLLRYLQVIFPLAMIGLGGEVFLNFLLNIYRPRRKGEVPRPAFDSRVLAFIAAPDRIAKSISEAINYQFGFEVTSGWFYQLLTKWVSVLAAVAGLIIWGMTCFTVLEPHQEGLVLRSGEHVRTIGPGPHVKAPWPLSKVEIPIYHARDTENQRRTIPIYTATGVRSMNLATHPPSNVGAILWTNEHGTEEFFIAVQPSSQATVDLAGQSKDVSLISAEIPLHYTINDVEKFDRFSAPETREMLLKAVAQREMMIYLVTRDVDEVLGEGRSEITAELHNRINAAFEELDAGIEILFVGLEGVHPPRTVAPAFEKVVGAEQKHEALLHDAQANAVVSLTSAAGSVAHAQEIASRIADRNELLAQMDQARQRGDSADQIAAQDTSLSELELEIQRMIEAAGGEAARILNEAGADRWRRHMGARRSAAAYEGQLSTYLAQPYVYRATLYFETLTEMIKDARLYITSSDVDELRTTIELQDSQLGGSVFKAEDETE